MASTLKINTLTGVSTAGSIAVTGEGNSTTTNLQQGLAKSWINLDGSGTIAIEDSFNVGSVTDEGTGAYLTVFSNVFSNAVYCYSGGMLMHTTEGTVRAQDNSNATTSQFSCDIFSQGSNIDQDHYCVAFHGDLA